MCCCVREFQHTHCHKQKHLLLHSSHMQAHKLLPPNSLTPVLLPGLMERLDAIYIYKTEKNMVGVHISHLIDGGLFLDNGFSMDLCNVVSH